MLPSHSHRKVEVRLSFRLNSIRITIADIYLLDNLQVAIDVSGDGRPPPSPYDVETGLFSITLFLTSYITGLNLTISNGTTIGWLNNSVEPPEFGCNNGLSSDFQNAGCQEVMLQESGSTVKHVNWIWPNCLVGDGGANDNNCGSGSDSASIQRCLEGNARGPYNVRLDSRSNTDLTADHV